MIHTSNNYYCHAYRCLKTTHHVRVVLRGTAYLYCVVCGRRLECKSYRPEREYDIAGEPLPTWKLDQDAA
jgi:hypothetical protein